MAIQPRPAGGTADPERLVPDLRAAASPLSRPAQRQLVRGPIPRDPPRAPGGRTLTAWTAEEWLGVVEIQSVLISIPLTLLWWNLMGAYGLFLGAMQTIVIAFLFRRRLARQAAVRLWRIKVKLPYFLDLLTLLMEAGSTFLERTQGSGPRVPAATDRRRVRAGPGEMNRGTSRITALEGLGSGFQDDELTSIIGAMIQGEQLAPSAHVSSAAQADVLRIKRTQRAETIAVRRVR